MSKVKYFKMKKIIQTALIAGMVLLAPAAWAQGKSAQKESKLKKG